MIIKKGNKLLIVGASGDLGYCLLKMLSKFDVIIGAHYNHRKERLDNFLKSDYFAKVKLFGGDASRQEKSVALIRSFVKWAGGIDGLIQLSGCITKPMHWQQLTQKIWDADIAVNLTGPFFLAQEAVKHMRKKGGKIIFASTASAGHGGGADSLAYGVAKAGIECLTKALARHGASDNILVNSVAPGFIMTDKRRKKPQKELKKRAELVLLRKAGNPEDIAAMIIHLLSSYGNFITGETIPISGGDWL